MGVAEDQQEPSTVSLMFNRLSGATTKFFGRPPSKNVNRRIQNTGTINLVGSAIGGQAVVARVVRQKYAACGKCNTVTARWRNAAADISIPIEHRHRSLKTKGAPGGVVHGLIRVVTSYAAARR